jgi:hypothetical protein
MHPDPYFIILLCLQPDDFTCEGGAATQWIKHCIHLVIQQDPPLEGYVKLLPSVMTFPSRQSLLGNITIGNILPNPPQFWVYK